MRPPPPAPAGPNGRPASLAPFATHWSAISALLDEALALPAAERAHWLDTLPPPQAQHREALRTLLSHQSEVETGDFMAALPRLDPASPVAGAGMLAAGLHIGPYRLIEEIGQGGMGTVWLAERADGLMSRRVALKLPRLVWGDALAERLGREREILATLAHEHIARLYDAGIDQHGRPFLAMEHVAGEAIDAHCTRHALTVRQRIELLLQVMAAVSHAHARLVVHRDLKPSNILVTPEGQVKLLDFGIAKLLEDQGRTALTELSGRALTPDYASPEQIRGERLGTASDIYSLGVVAYELLAGTRPYRLKRGTAAEIEEAIANAEPRRASEAATDAATKKALRGDLDAILHHALRKPVAERYASVDAFAADLHRHLRGEPVHARPDRAAYRLAKFVGRHRGAVAMGTALLGSVVAGAGIATWQAQVAREQEARALSEVRRQRAVQDLYIETLSRLSVLAVDQPEALLRPNAVTSVLQEKLREMAPRTAQLPDERGAQLEATMLQLNFANRFEESLAVGEDYLAHLKSHDAAPSLIINAHAALGRTLFQLRRWDDSETMRRAGLQWAPEAHDRETALARMEAGTDLGGILTARGKRAEALAALTLADADVARRFGNEHLRSGTLTKLGIFYLGFDDARALQTLRQARAELQANGTAEPDDVAQVSWQLGDALLATGQAAEAEAAQAEAMAVYRREYGRASRNAVRAFSRVVGAAARLTPARATAMLTEERQALTANAGGLPRAVELILRAREVETAWLAGDTQAALAPPPPEASELLSPAFLREHELLLINRSRALVLAGRGSEALVLLNTLAASWLDPGRPTVQWLRLQEALASAQLAAGQFAAAGRTAADMRSMLAQEQATGSRFYRAATSLAAWAAARNGDRPAAQKLLAELDAAPPAFPSGPERAEVELRRAHALLALSQPAAAATVARDLMPYLAGQHPDSPRLQLAHQLMSANAAPRFAHAKRALASASRQTAHIGSPPHHPSAVSLADQNVPGNAPPSISTF